MTTITNPKSSISMMCCISNTWYLLMSGIQKEAINFGGLVWLRADASDLRCLKELNIFASVNSYKCDDGANAEGSGGAVASSSAQLCNAQTNRQKQAELCNPLDPLRLIVNNNQGWIKFGIGEMEPIQTLLPSWKDSIDRCEFDLFQTLPNIRQRPEECKGLPQCSS